METVNPTKIHTSKCPKLYGGDCNCDSYHTFGELYDQRSEVYIALCRIHDKEIWRSHTHSDGTCYQGWFIMGIGKEKGSQISFHLAEKYWDETTFAETLEQAPEWDKHTSADVILRLKKL